jgi:hypothetical protein
MPKQNPSEWTIQKLRKRCKQLYPDFRQRPGMTKQELLKLMSHGPKIRKLEHRGGAEKPTRDLSRRRTNMPSTKNLPSTKNIHNLDQWLKNVEPTKTMWREFYKVIRWFAYLIHNGVVDNQSVCLTDVSYKGMSVLSYVMNMCNTKSCQIKFDPLILKKIKNCPNNSLVLLDVAIFNSSEPGSEGHANCLIIDLGNKTIERFEPYGDMYSVVDKAIENQFVKKHFPDFEYIDPLKFIPKHGPQYIQSQFGNKLGLGGFCITFSFLYFHLRIVNPEKSKKDVVSMIMKGSPEDIDVRIRKFIAMVNKFVPSKEDGEVFEQFDRKYLEPVRVYA